LEEPFMRRKPTEEEIAARARELHEQHGGRHERALSDWLQARRELEAVQISAESAEVRPKPRIRARKRSSARR
jgi:hypothetical protein